MGARTAATSPFADQNSETLHNHDHDNPKIRMHTTLPTSLEDYA